MSVHMKQIQSLRITQGKEKKDWVSQQLYSVSGDDCSSPTCNAYGHPLRGWPCLGIPQVPHVHGVLLGGGAKDCDCCSFCKTACSSPKKSVEWLIALERISLIVQTHVSSYWQTHMQSQEQLSRTNQLCPCSFPSLLVLYGFVSAQSFGKLPV